MPSEPTEAELLRRAIENRLLDVHTQIPAVVESYDQNKQTIDARVCLKRAIASDDQATIYEELPILRNIPVMFPRGGGFCITFPLKKDDPVRLVFDEEYAGDYRVNGTVPSSPKFTGRFNLSSCVAYPGAGSELQVLLGVLNAGMVLGFEGGTFGGPAQIHFVLSGDPPQSQIWLGPDITSKVALASQVAAKLNSVIHTIKTATASGTETGLAVIIGQLQAAFPSVPEVAEGDIGATRVFAQ